MYILQAEQRIDKPTEEAAEPYLSFVLSAVIETGLRYYLVWNVVGD